MTTNFLPKVLGLLLVFIGFQASAQELGEITEITPDHVIKFYKGNIDLQEGEELIGKGKGSGVYLFKVTATEGDKASANFIGQQIQWGGMARGPEVGDKIRVEPKRVDSMFADFYLGYVQAKSEYGFPGRGSAIGMSVGGHFTELWSWDIRLQADSWGKDSFDVEKRRSSYMLGVGYNPGQFRLKGYLGTVDTMTILESPNPTGYTDPYTGKIIYAQGVQHDSKWGYFLSLGYQVNFSKMNRNKHFAWFVLPQVTYANVFGSSPYPAHTSVGVSIGFENSMF